MNVQKNSEKGFTIIEVVLVLAIAGLIFLMVFIALPALQRNQRDSARKNDVGIVASAITSYTSNNKGQFPTTTAQIQNYASNLSNGTTISVKPTGTYTGSGTGATNENVAFTPKTKCDTSVGNGAVTSAGATARQFTVVVKLESGSNVYFCQDS
jgi:prepilin-type N-terminal cleavage/methylation domain-containing protein